MPGRKTPLATGEMYHVFNRGIDRRITFTNKREHMRAIDSLLFYKNANPPISYSKYLRLEDEKRDQINKILEENEKIVEIHSFVLMPNHFHFLLRQVKDGGISKFVGNFLNCHTRYFNIKHERDGSLFLDQFKSVRIETDEQLVHVSRYIHLNPYTGYIVKSLEDLEKYPWSSFPDYINTHKGFVQKDLILGMFKNPAAYKTFVFDQANYQRELKKIEPLIFE